MTVDTTPSTPGNAATDRLNNAGVSNRPAYVALAFVGVAFLLVSHHRNSACAGRDYPRDDGLQADTPPHGALCRRHRRCCRDCCCRTDNNRGQQHRNGQHLQCRALDISRLKNPIVGMTLRKHHADFLWYTGLYTHKYIIFACIYAIKAIIHLRPAAAWPASTHEYSIKWLILKLTYSGAVRRHHRCDTCRHARWSTTATV